jgi:hypothetical protein
MTETTQTTQITQKTLIKALLLSLFVLPGAGHAVFKKKLRGAVFSGAVFILVVIMVLHVSSAMNESMNSVPAETAQMSEILALSQSLTSSVMVELAAALNIYIWIFILLYVGGIVDLVFLYKKQKDENNYKT